MYHQLPTLTASLASGLSDRQDATFLTLLTRPKFLIGFSSCCLVSAGDLLKTLVVLYSVSLFYTVLVMSGGRIGPRSFQHGTIVALSGNSKHVFVTNGVKL